jgi:hypothetical protein
MPALPKPHRIAVLLPAVALDGADGAYEREAAALLWMACIELCQRHPRLAVLDPEATPLFPQDGHFAPQHAAVGAQPTDAFYGPTRRDELIRLELAPGARQAGAGGSSKLRLHVIGRGGAQVFEGQGRGLGEPLEQAIGAWLAARGLGALPRRIEPIAIEELVAVVRVIAPTLVEQARAWSRPAPALDRTLALLGDPDDPDEPAAPPAPEADAASAPRPRRSLARPLAARLPGVLRVPALRLLELALGEDLGDLVLVADREHPQARLARLAKDVPASALHAVIAAAPGWARPYELLAGGAASPSELEAVAAAGMAALCRPAQLDALAAAAARLADDARADEGLRLVERAVALEPESPRAHLARLDVLRRTDRIGAWLAEAEASARRLGCPREAALPWSPDQIQIDLRVSAALLAAGRLDEAIALRDSRLAGRADAWPVQARVLDMWRSDPRIAAAAYAREGYLRGDEARAVEGFAHAPPRDGVGLAMFLDALVALGHEADVPLAWAELGLGRVAAPPAIARLAAVQGLAAAGAWRGALEELWRVELCHPGRDAHPAIARSALVLAATPIEVVEAALAERIAIGAPSLARRMARVCADLVPAAAKSGLVARALGRPSRVDFDPAWLAAFAPDTRSRRALDAAFAELGALRAAPPQGFDIADELQRGDRLVNGWLQAAFAEAGEDDPAALAQAAAYAAAQALARYLAATTAPPTTLAGALRTVAGEALELVRTHRAALDDRDARAVLATIEPILRRVDRWIGTTWLGVVERCLGLDERSGGDVAGFARDTPTVAARVLGPEETAVLSWSVARLARERASGWAAKIIAQASRLAWHTGYAGAPEWAEAIAAQLDARAIDREDAIDALHTACYLADGRSAVPCVHAARVLFDAGRAAAALAVLSGGLRAAPPAARDAALAQLADRWAASQLDVPLDTAAAADAARGALGRGELPRAEKLARWAVARSTAAPDGSIASAGGAGARDPADAANQRLLGVALARQGKLEAALAHLALGAGERAAPVLACALYDAGQPDEAFGVLEHATRWCARAEPWLQLGDLAHAAGDAAGAARAYGAAHQLDPAAFDARQLETFADVAGGAPSELVSIPPHRSAMLRGPAQPGLAIARAALPIYARLEAGEHAAAAAQLGDAKATWRVRHVALRASRFRTATEPHVAVTSRARAAALAALGDTLGIMDRDGLLARALALRIREEVHFARDPVPRLGERMAREAFSIELRTRGAVIARPPAAPPREAFADRVVVEGARLARAAEYVGLLRDLAALAPAEALAQLGLDDDAYLELARAWAAALEADPSLLHVLELGLAAR